MLAQVIILAVIIGINARKTSSPVINMLFKTVDVSIADGQDTIVFAQVIIFAGFRSIVARKTSCPVGS